MSVRVYRSENTIRKRDRFSFKPGCKPGLIDPMRITPVLTALCLLLGSGLTGLAAHHKNTIQVFNGKNLEGWSVEGGGQFSVEKGVLKLNRGTGWLRSKDTFNPIKEVRDLRGKSVLLITADAAFDRIMNENFSAALIAAKVGHHIITLEGAHTFPVVQESLPVVLDFVRNQTDQ